LPKLVANCSDSLRAWNWVNSPEQKIAASSYCHELVIYFTKYL
jgi:hypothetical protein